MNYGFNLFLTLSVSLWFPIFYGRLMSHVSSPMPSIFVHLSAFIFLILSSSKDILCMMEKLWSWLFSASVWWRNAGKDFSTPRWKSTKQLDWREHGMMCLDSLFPELKIICFSFAFVQNYHRTKTLFHLIPCPYHQKWSFKLKIHFPS